ncbi:hypothetical protein BRC60_03960 [Halobacteriales archaeon QH_1_68_42]|nr:MAG: hypothetical protein BRC60_03960 [Halobacteriales archaeon QH_1_68_42]
MGEPARVHPAVGGGLDPFDGRLGRRERPEAVEVVDVRAEYERAKRAAVATHPEDVDAYTDAKESTIEELTERAYREGYGERLPAFA